MALLVDSYSEEPDNEGIRTVLRLKPEIAPITIAVFPLLRNKEELVKAARGVYESLKDSYVVAWDDIGNIGKRYRRQDEIGTPWCITIDFKTLSDQTVTVRDRDSMKQERVKIKELISFFEERLKGKP
jgi:glycyl-tRNA synthetase